MPDKVQQLVDQQIQYYRQRDIFRWEPDTTYDFVFFGCWLTHVPLSRFAAFWDILRAALKPGGSVSVVDNRVHAVSSARSHLSDPGRVTQRRQLNDGRAFEIVKVYHEPDGLAARLEPLGWGGGDYRMTTNSFIYGSATLAR